MAKLSISVPDDLWEAVRKEGNTRSEVVQIALRGLRDRLEGEVPLWPDDPDLRDLVSQKTAEARALRDKGYKDGFRAAASSDWTEVERIDGEPGSLAAMLMAELEFDHEMELGNIDVQQEDFRLRNETAIGLLSKARHTTGSEVPMSATYLQAFAAGAIAFVRRVSADLGEPST